MTTTGAAGQPLPSPGASEPHEVSPVRRIITVCTANLCRSPLAAAALTDAFRREALDIEVSSAGVQALEGRRPPETWLEICADLGFDLTDHRSTHLSGLSTVASLAVGMTAEHARSIAAVDQSLIGRISLIEPLATDPGPELERVRARRAFDLLRLDDRLDVADPVRAPMRVQREIARRIVDLAGQVAARWPR